MRSESGGTRQRESRVEDEIANLEESEMTNGFGVKSGPVERARVEEIKIYNERRRKPSWLEARGARRYVCYHNTWLYIVQNSALESVVKARG